MMYCYVCKEEGKASSYHMFPKNPEMRIEWLAQFGFEEVDIMQYTRVCSNHFEESCFTHNNERKMLLRGSIPTRNLGKRTKKRKKIVVEDTVLPQESVAATNNVYPIQGIPNQFVIIQNPATTVPQTIGTLQNSNTNGSNFSKNTTSITRVQPDENEIEIHEMKSEDLDYACDRCSYVTDFFSSYQVHADNCTRTKKKIQPEKVTESTISVKDSNNSIKDSNNMHDYGKQSQGNSSFQECNSSSKETGASNIVIKREHITDYVNDEFEIIEEVTEVADQQNDEIGSEIESLEKEINLIEQEEGRIEREIEIIEQEADVIQQKSTKEINEAELEFISKQIQSNDSWNNSHHNLLRLVGRHFPDRVIPTKSNPNTCWVCTVCLSKDKQRRRRTRYICKICGVGLCAAPCFGLYHTEINY